VGVEILVHSKFSARVNRARLTRVARRALRAERAPAGAGLTIYVTTDAEIRALNRKFHATNAATDVLAFPARSMPRSKAEWRRHSGTLVPHYEQEAYVGDIVISYDRARVQAHVAHWRIADELDLLAVHGILHLFGYDDRTPRKRAQMWQRQEEILGRVAGAT